MLEAEIERRLVDLAQEAGLVVRAIRGTPQGEAESPAASGVCRVRDEGWVVLALCDAPEQRIAVLSQALRSHARELLESRYLPPALRERIGV